MPERTHAGAAKKRALVVYGGYFALGKKGTPEFVGIAGRVELDLKKRGYEVQLSTVFPPSGVTYKYEVLVLLAHGGMDGPLCLFQGEEYGNDPELKVYQVGPGWGSEAGREVRHEVDTAAWPLLVIDLRNALERGAIVVVAACHSDGLDTFEMARVRAMHKKAKRAAELEVMEKAFQHGGWVHSLASGLGDVYVAGVQGTTGDPWMKGTVDWALDGGKPAQRSVVYGPGGVKLPQWEGWNKVHARARAR